MWWLLLLAGAMAASRCRDFVENKNNHLEANDARITYLHFYGFTRSDALCATRAQNFIPFAKDEGCEDRKFVTKYIIYHQIRKTCWLAHDSLTKEVANATCKPSLPSFKMTKGAPQGDLIDTESCIAGQDKRMGPRRKSRVSARVGLKTSAVNTLSIPWDKDCERALNFTCCASYCDGFVSKPEAKESKEAHTISVMLDRDVPLDEGSGNRDQMLACQRVLHAHNKVINTFILAEEKSKILKEQLFTPFRYVSVDKDGLCSISKPAGLSKDLTTSDFGPQCWKLAEMGAIVPQAGAKFMSSSKCEGQATGAGGVYSREQIQALLTAKETNEAPVCRKSRDCKIGEWTRWQDTEDKEATKKNKTGHVWSTRTRAQNILEEAGGQPCRKIVNAGPETRYCMPGPCATPVPFCQKYANPCLHEGVCTNHKEKGFVCECKDGYWGTTCELQGLGEIQMSCSVDDEYQAKFIKQDVRMKVDQGKLANNTHTHTKLANNTKVAE